MENDIRLKGEGSDEKMKNKLKTVEELNAEEEESEKRQVQRLLADTVSHSMPMDDIKLILKYGGDVNRPVNRGMMPLHYAAYADNLDAMKLFIKLGCEVNAKNDEGLTPVHMCAKKGNYKCLKYLIQHGAHVNIDNKEYTPMLRKKSVMLVEDSLNDAMQNGIDITKMEQIQESPNEESAMKLATEEEVVPPSSNTECNGYIIPETNFVCDASDDSEEYVSQDATVEPINLALENKHMKVVKLLLENGANPNRRYFMGYEINLLPPKNIEYLDLLLKYGANPNCVNRSGFTPLMTAAKEGETQAVRLLIKRGADVNQQRPQRFEQKTALHIALEAGNLSVARILLLQHAYVSRSPNYKYNALHTAVLTDRVDLVELVLCFPQDIDETTDENCSALMLVAASTSLKNQIPIIKLLLQAGADPNFHPGAMNYTAPCLSSLSEYLSNHENIDYNIVFLLIQSGAWVRFAGASTVVRKKDPFGVLLYMSKIRTNQKLLQLLIEASSVFDEHAISTCKEVNEEEKKSFIALANQPFSLKKMESGSWTEEQRHGTEENPENDTKNPENSKDLEDETRRRSLQSDLVKAIVHKLPLENIQKLLQLGADIDGPMEYGMRPIHFAASANNIEVIDFCLKFGCDINCKDCCGLTPIHLSAQKGHVDCLRYLISQGANVKVDNRGYKASKKVKNNNMGVENKSKNVESDENNAGVDNQIATENDDENNDEEDNTSGKAPKGFTKDLTVEPLNFALENNHEEAVKLLLENGANPNRWYPVGYEINLVPLKNVKCLELMLDFGASPNAVDRCGYTPLMMAAKKNQMLATQLLLHWGANVNQQRPDRFEMKTALHIALEAGNRDIAKVLLIRGAITVKLPDYKYNAVHTAVLTDRVDLVELVLFFHGDVDEVTDDNCTALMLACAHTDLQNQMLIIHKLLQNGANPNYHSGITNYSAPSFSPLVEYLSNQQILDYNIVLKLIQYGAKVHFSGSSRVIRKKDPYGILSYIPCLKMNENAWGLVIDATSLFDISAISQCNYFTEEEKKFFLILGTQPFSLRHLVRLSIRKLLKPPLTKKLFTLPLPRFLLKYLLFLVG